MHSFFIWVLFQKILEMKYFIHQERLFISRKFYENYRCNAWLNKPVAKNLGKRRLLVNCLFYVSIQGFNVVEGAGEFLPARLLIFHTCL